MNAKLRPWVIGGALACLLVLAVGWFLLVSPKRSEAATVRAQVATQEAANQVLRGQIGQLQEQAKSLVAKQAELQGIARRVPDGPQLPGLIRALEDARGRAGVDLVSVTPSAPTATGPVVAGAAAYQVIPISLSVHGDYAQMTLFLDELETLQRLYLVKGVTITPQAAKAGTTTLGPDGSPETPHTLSAAVVGEVYTTSADTTTLSLPALTAPATGAVPTATPAPAAVGVATPASAPAGSPAAAPAGAATQPTN